MTAPVSQSQEFFTHMIAEDLINEDLKAIKKYGEREVEALHKRFDVQKQEIFEGLKRFKEFNIEDIDNFHILQHKYEKIVYENELLRKAHPDICLRRFLSVSLLVSALAAGIIGAAVGCVVTAVIGFSIAAVACVPVMLNYAKEAEDLVDEQIAREEKLKNNNEQKG
jgi:hypothetical protein